MKIKIMKLHINNYIKIGIFILLIKTFWGNIVLIPYTGAIDSVLTVLACAFFLLEILYQKYSINTLAIYAVVVILSLFSASKTGSFGLMSTVITCLVLRKENLVDVITYMYQVEKILFSIVFIMAIIMSLFGGLSLTMNVNGMERFAFGFTHPNVFSAIAFNIIMMWVWINFNRMTPKRILTLILVELLLFYFTRTRTTLILEMIMDILIVIPFSIRILSKIAMVVTPTMAFITYVLAVLFMRGNPFAIMMNTVLSSRVKLTAYALEKFGLTIFGNNLQGFRVNWEANWGLNDFTFDNLYSSFFSSVGIIWLIACTVLFFLVARKKDRKFCVYIILWALYGMTEVHGSNCYIFFPILVVTTLFTKGTGKKQYGLNKQVGNGEGIIKKS